MTNLHPNAKSLVYGLSDFWTLYFKELPVIEELYRGMEIEVGQAYLDLMALFLNVSAQDATLFNKQFFKLIRLREDAVTYASDGKYGVALETDVAGLKYINNKVFDVTRTLERGVDFTFDDATRSALFNHDPFSAYRARTFGQFTVTSRVPNPEASQITLELVDAGTHPPTLSRSQYALSVAYDATRTTAQDVISLLNASADSQGLVRATLSGTGDGTGAVTAVAATPLQRQATAPLEGFAARTFEVLFGTRFSDASVPRWTDLDVEKGDAVRIIGGGSWGSAQEFPIALVRDGSLLFYPQAAPEMRNGLQYAVLRSPLDDQVRNEPFGVSGKVTTLDTNASITAASRTITFSAATSLSEFHVGEQLLLGSSLNAGQYPITAVLSATEITVSGGPLVDETGVTVELATAIDSFVLSGCALSGTTFTFTPGDLPAVSSGVLVLSRSGVHEKYEITGLPAAGTYTLNVPAGTADGTGLGAAVALPTASNSTFIYSWPIPGSVSIAARRFLDAQAVVEGRDYIVNYDLGVVRPITPWEPSTLVTAEYRYRNAQHTGTTGIVEVDEVTETVTELGVWAPDTLIDKYHLYFTYGYLINRVERSTETYRSLIRGVFQLFMLGPTLERFESAVNIVAGLPVIRDDGEILLSYDSGALRSGTDGVFSETARTFTSATASFTVNDLRNRIYVTSGANATKTFSIQSVVSPTTVELVETPVSESAAGWEITATGKHAIVTSRARYEFPRAAALKPRFIDPNNAGVLELRAFEVVSAAFEVTDHVETPYWWESSQIPKTLAPDMSPARRQSTPQLFENIVAPADSAEVGDPGFFIGADSEGETLPRAVLRASVGADGVLYGDPLYPVSTTETFFEATSGAFTDADVGNYVRMGGDEYLITSRVSSTRVKIQAWLPLAYNGTTPAAWELVTGTLPLRHAASYVILDRWMKYHLFTVRFDGFLIDTLSQSVLLDLQELVFAAKPLYTYLALQPSLLFEERIRMQEDNLSVLSRYMLAGQAGEVVAANINPLTIGPHWKVGTWFRYVEKSGTFATPTTAVAGVLGVAPGGYDLRVSHIHISDDLTLGGVPVPRDTRVFIAPAGIGGMAATLTVSGDQATLNINDPLQQMSPDMLMQYVSIGGKRYRIGQVEDDQTVVLYATDLSDATGVTWQYETCGSAEARITHDAEGQSFFEDLTGTTNLSGQEGTLIRAMYPTGAEHQTYRMGASVSATKVHVEKKHYLVADGSPIMGAVTTSGPSKITLPDAFLWPDMCYDDRRAEDPTTALQKRYYVEFLTGPDEGEVRQLITYVSSTEVLLEGAVTPATGLEVTFFCLEAYGETHAGALGVWEHFERAVWVDTYATAANTLHLIDGLDAHAAVAYEAYGVQIPEDPSTGTFDAGAGDTYYVVGGLEPAQQYLRSRTSQDPDLQESPIQITTTVLP